MKRKFLKLIPIAAVTCFAMLSGCKKYNEYPSHVAQISFPVVTLVGPLDTTINHGTTWVDPGATWIDTVTNETGKLTVSVNTTKDSAYILVYTATNKNGFQATVTRGLGVTNYNGPLSLAGPYTDNTGNYDSLYLVSRALFYHPNIDLYGDNGVVVIKTDGTIAVSAIQTEVTGTNGVPLPVTFTQASVTFSPAPITFGYTVTILNVPPYAAQFQHN